MRFFDFSSWEGILFTFLGIAMFTLISMGIRLIMMFTIQQKQQRTNRQINERLKTLIAAYKTLGGSFTGNLSVDPTHLRDLRRKAEIEGDEEDPSDEELVARDTSFDRPRRIRDAVEAALSDIILLGTEEQVKLAAEASRDLVAGKPVYTDKLVVSLRDFIRAALDLAPIPTSIEVPSQGPTRPSSAGGRGRGGGGGGEGGRGGGGGGGGGGMAGGGGMGMGMGMGLGSRNTDGTT